MSKKEVTQRWRDQPGLAAAAARWSGLDLTYADLSGLWFFDVVEDCILDQASLKDSRLLGVECSRTSLVGADLQQATVGGATADSLPDETPFVVVNLAEWEQPHAVDMEAALFGEGQRNH